MEKGKRRRSSNTTDTARAMKAKHPALDVHGTPFAEALDHGKIAGKRIEEVEQQLTRRSQIEEKVDEVAFEVQEDREESNTPFFEY